MRISFALVAIFSTVTSAYALTQHNAILERATPTIRHASQVQERISLCTLYAYHAANGYEVLNNLWGKDKSTSGSQCTYYEGAVDSGIKWSTEWTWNGGENDVKSYAYAGRQLTKGNLVSKVKSLPTTINWSYNTTSLRANVAYDIFTASDPNHVNSSGDYELMIWLNRYGGVWPITESGKPIASVTIAGYKFDLYFGYNGSMKVYSFVTSDGSYNSFSADIKLFFDYLTTNQNYPASTQNLIVYQIGTEAFTGGPAKFTVSKFVADVKL